MPGTLRRSRTYIVVPRDVNPENFLAMIETTKEHGTYPIDREKLLAELA